MASTVPTSREEISQWVQEAAKLEGLTNTEIIIHSTGNDSGFTGDFAFAKLKGVTEDGKKKEIDLAVKFGKKDEEVRMEIYLGDIYMRELFVYGQVFKTFDEFQDEKRVQDKFDGYPKCYGTLIRDGTEIVLLEDLRSAGYVLHDNRTPMNDEHIELILKNYAQFHAVSFAFKDQNRSKFEEMFKDYNSNIERSRSHVVINPDLISRSIETAKTLEPKLTERFLANFPEGFEEAFNKYFLDVPEETVVTHSDCWNNNFMMKYLKGHPTKVAILDWQLSNLHSPVLDISYFLYACASSDQLSRVEDYLRFYYKHLSNNIKEMGSDPYVLFPYTRLRKHWKLYRVYGVLVLLSWLDTMLFDKDEVLSFHETVDTAEGDLENVISDIGEKMTQSTIALYEKRLVEIIRQYLKDQ